MKDFQIDLLKESYQRDGYVFIPGFLDKKEIQALKHSLEKLIAEKLGSMPDNHVMYEDKNDSETLKQLQDLQLYDPFFSSVLFKSKFENIAEQLMEDKAIGKTVEYFNKPKRIGKPTPPHQDAYYFMIKPPEAVTMWLALEDVNEENGCVRYVKGSHLLGMREHGRTQTLGFSQAIVDYPNANDRINEVAMPAQPGDLLIHHAMTIHRADGNKSLSRTRKAMGLIYFSASAKEDKEAKELYLKKLQQEKVLNS